MKNKFQELENRVYNAEDLIVEKKPRVKLYVFIALSTLTLLARFFNQIRGWGL